MMRKHVGFWSKVRIAPAALLAVSILVSGCASSSQGSGDSGQGATDSRAAETETNSNTGEDSTDAAASVAGVSAENALPIPALTQTECTWDENGKVTGEVSRDLDGRPAMNARGFHEARYSYDSHGNLTLEEYFDTSGNVVATVDGYARAEYTYRTDGGGNSYVLTEDRYAADGTRADIPGGYSYRRDEWDGDQILSTSFYDAQDELTRPTGGYARITYDARQGKRGVLEITKTYYDADGSLLIGTEGGAVVVSEYTSESYPVSVHAPSGEDIGADDMITGTARGIVDGSQRRNTDETGGAGTEGISGTQSGVGGTEGSMTGGAGISRTSGYVARKLLSRKIYGTDKQKVLGANRWHDEENIYDSEGHRTRTDYLDADGDPILSSSGFASAAYTYDDKGRVTEIEYYDINGDLIKILAGYARATFEYYEDNGMLHYVRYYGADGERTMITDGYSMVGYAYNGADYDLQVTFYDILDQYTMSKDGRARQETIFRADQKSKLDSYNTWMQSGEYILQDKYFGTDLNLIELKGGYAGYVNEVNEHNQVVSTTYMDDTWQPTRDQERQFSTIRYEYEGTDEDEPAVREAYFDEKGEPCESKDGYYARRMEYGGPQKTLLLSEEYLDAEGKADKSVSTGASIVTYTFDKNRTQTSSRYYDADKKPVSTQNGYASLLREFNSAGSLLWETTLGTDGSLVNAGGQYAAQTHTYDYSGHLTGEKYFSEDGTALTQSAGYASVQYAYDLDGNIISTTYFNAADEAVAVGGKARVRREYDENHHVIYEAYDGVDLNPVLSEDGYAAKRTEYDGETGLVSRVDYYDTEGELILLPDGYASYTQKYDTNGNLRERSYYDETGALTAPASAGYDSFERKCDDNGHITEEAYYQADGSLLVNKDNYAVVTNEYDDNGNCTATSYLDDKREPAQTSFGYARMEMTSDFQGNQTSVAYFDADEKPVNIPDGYHRMESSWDLDG
ncbi:MAG: hypothetical protein Q4C02_09065, partial [Eubacteriales bacterium]|nr:hypothetical protein [Eubacteriales bacterium]